MAAAPAHPDGFLTMAADTAVETTASDKSMVAALLLCLFLGGLGMHRFYAGKIGTAVLQLLMLGVGFIALMITLIAGAAAIVAEVETGVADANAEAGFGAGAVITWLVWGALGLWVLIDFIRIVAGKFPDKQGRALRTS